MPVYKRVSGAWVSTTVKRKVSGAFANATSVKRRSGGAWIECLLTNHTTSVPPVSGYTIRPGTLSNNVTATVTGGTGPFTYAWSWASGGTSIALSNTTLATCFITSTVTGSGVTVNRGGSLQCVVTDTGNSNFQTTTAGAVNYTFETNL